METATSPVHVELLPTACGRRIAVATLDAERSLNSLTLAMVDVLLPQLAAWANDAQVLAVLLRGRGERAFCAGGDVRALTAHARTGEGDAGLAGLGHGCCHGRRHGAVAGRSFSRGD